MADGPVLSMAARIRAWLLENPGYHFAGDVHAGMGVTDTKARQTVSGLLANMANDGFIDKQGRPGTQRYAANAFTARRRMTQANEPRPSPVERAFEKVAAQSGWSGETRDFIAAVRLEAARLGGGS